MIRSLTESLFPNLCMACRKTLAGPEPFCPACARLVEPLSQAVCTVCASPLPAYPDGGECLRCIRRETGFDAFYAAFHYGGPIKEAILALKHSGRLEFSDRLATLLARKMADRIPADCAGVTSVPLHPRRLTRRGYNQAEILSKGLAKRLGLPHRPALLRRIRDTGTQGRKGAKERAENVRCAFRPMADRRPISGQIILVDDVATSFSTLSECANALKMLGFYGVHACSLAVSGVQE
jgi:ComF family protein